MEGSFLSPQHADDLVWRGGARKKDTDFERIGRFFLSRLESVFPRVADNPLYLYNGRNVPIYLLCFAAANERNAHTAVKIAKDILGK